MDFLKRSTKREKNAYSEEKKVTQKDSGGEKDSREDWGGKGKTRVRTFLIGRFSH